MHATPSAERAPLPIAIAGLSGVAAWTAAWLAGGLYVGGGPGGIAVAAVALGTCALLASGRRPAVQNELHGFVVLMTAGVTVGFAVVSLNTDGATTAAGILFAAGVYLASVWLISLVDQP